jgi:hypothetical protein
MFRQPRLRGISFSFLTFVQLICLVYRETLAVLVHTGIDGDLGKDVLSGLFSLPGN